MTEQRMSIYEISDADEPGACVLQGMAHGNFDGVLLVLICNEEPDDFDWFGTPRTHSGQPTRPVLLFYTGEPPTNEEALEYVCSLAKECTRSNLYNEPRQLLDFVEPEVLRTIPFHLHYPPYPWLEEAKLGMEMGRYFNRCSLEKWQDATEDTPGSFTFKFWREPPEGPTDIPLNFPDGIF